MEPNSQHDLKIGKTPNFRNVDILIIDNTAFVSGFNLNVISQQNPNIQIFVTPEIIEETEKNPRSKQLIEIALSQEILKIESPSQEFLSQVKKKATQSGDIGALSKPDQSIIALALELKTQNPSQNILLMSDDYSIQNTCVLCGIHTFSFQKEGIKKKIDWEIYCPHCFHKFPPQELGKECEFCGGILKRRKSHQKKH